MASSAASSPDEPIDPFASPTDQAVDPFAAPPQPDGSKAIDPFQQPGGKTLEPMKVEVIGQGDSDMGPTEAAVAPRPEDARPISVISWDKDFSPVADGSQRSVDFRPTVFDAAQAVTPEEQARIDAERDAAEIEAAEEAPKA